MRTGSSDSFAEGSSSPTNGVEFESICLELDRTTVLLNFNPGRCEKLIRSMVNKNKTNWWSDCSAILHLMDRQGRVSRFFDSTRPIWLPHMAQDPLILISLSRDGAEVRASVCKFFLSIAKSRRKFVLLESSSTAPRSFVSLIACPATRIDGSHLSNLQLLPVHELIQRFTASFQNLGPECPAVYRNYSTSPSHQHFCSAI